MGQCGIPETGLEMRKRQNCQMAAAPAQRLIAVHGFQQVSHCGRQSFGIGLLARGYCQIKFQNPDLA